jgi:hypothetical protein
MDSRLLMTLQVGVVGAQRIGGDPKHALLNRLLAVSSGDRRAEGPIYTIDEIL